MSDYDFSFKASDSIGGRLDFRIEGLDKEFNNRHAVTFFYEGMTIQYYKPKRLLVETFKTINLAVNEIQEALDSKRQEVFNKLPNVTEETWSKPKRVE